MEIAAMEENRILKYRVWSEKYGSFLYWGFQESGVDDRLMFVSPPMSYDLNTVSVLEKSEQCTGLRDVANKLIYVGDIKRDPGDGGDLPPYYCVMTWIREWAMFAWLEVSEWEMYQLNGVEALDTTMYWSYPSRATGDDRDEVVGNIHENGDLLVAMVDDDTPEGLDPYEAFGHNLGDSGDVIGRDSEFTSGGENE
jgi:hypothetical protein